MSHHGLSGMSPAVFQHSLDSLQDRVQILHGLSDKVSSLSWDLLGSLQDRVQILHVQHVAQALPVEVLLGPCCW
jgi:hypothetical protein